jgi:hypothetical protein
VDRRANQRQIGEGKGRGIRKGIGIGSGQRGGRLGGREPNPQLKKNLSAEESQEPEVPGGGLTRVRIAL